VALYVNSPVFSGSGDAGVSSPYARDWDCHIPLFRAALSNSGTDLKAGVQIVAEGWEQAIYCGQFIS
jgi:hypothetical protein